MINLELFTVCARTDSGLPDRQSALKRVQMYHFILTEAALFLDTHPDNQTALAYYGKQKQLYEQAHTEFTNLYGPISHNDINGCAENWDWVKGPWPWEGDM